MSISRHSRLVRGPAIVQFHWTTGSGGSAVQHNVVFRTKGDVVFTPETQTFDVESSELGVIDRRASELMATVRFTPVGVVDSDGVGILWPHLQKLPGQSLFGAQDVLVEVWPVAGAAASANDNGMIYLQNAVVSKMPDIILSAVQTEIGEVEVRGILSNNSVWESGAHWTMTDENAPTLSTLSPSSIPTVPAKLAWGTAFSDIKTENGVRIEFEMGTQDEVEDESGVYDITLTDLKARARFTPVAGWDMEEVYSALHQNDDQLRGSSVYRQNLVATSKEAGGLIVTLYGAALLTMPMTYGATSKRIGELTLEGIRGTGNAIAAVSIATAQTAAPRSTSSATPSSGDGEGEGGEGGDGEGSGTTGT